jgi:hypothetical protein
MGLAMERAGKVFLQAAWGQGAEGVLGDVIVQKGAVGELRGGSGRGQSKCPEAEKVGGVERAVREAAAVRWPQGKGPCRN